MRRGKNICTALKDRGKQRAAATMTVGATNHGVWCCQVPQLVAPNVALGCTRLYHLQNACCRMLPIYKTELNVIRHKQNLQKLISLLVTIIVAAIIMLLQSSCNKQPDSPKKRNSMERKQMQAVAKEKKRIKMVNVPAAVHKVVNILPPPIIKQDKELLPEPSSKTVSIPKSRTKHSPKYGAAKNAGASPDTVNETDCWQFVEEMPSFPGGAQAMNKFIASNIQLLDPDDCSFGTEIVQFTVERDGSLSNVHVKRHISWSLDSAVVCVVRSMPCWLPGKHKGMPVRVTMTLPIQICFQ